MSSYLNNLVARYLDKPNVIQPRLASLYEPLTIGGMIGAHRDTTTLLDTESLEQENGIVERIERRMSVETSTDMRPSLTDSSFDEAPMTVWRGQQLKPLPSQLLTKPQLIPPNESPAPISAQSSSSQIQTFAPPADTNSPDPLPSVENEAPLPSILKGEADVSPQVVRYYLNAPATPIINVRGESREQVSATDIQPPIIDAPLIDLTKKGILIQPRVAMRVENQKATNNSSSLSHPTATQPEPTINITIGRVEVRATLPQPVARRQASAPPLMGLDEYLRKRAKGDDR